MSPADGMTQACVPDRPDEPDIRSGQRRPGPDEILAVLARCRWFRRLDGAGLRHALQEGSLVTLPKNRVLFRTGDPSTEVYILISGRIAISTTGFNGREIGFRHYEPGDGFGELAALDNKPRSANAKAVAPTRLLRIPAAGFHRLFSAHPSVAEEVLKSLARLVRALSDRIAENGAKAPVRIIGGIVRLAETAAPRPDAVRVQIVPAPTDEELASRCDSHREAVNRVINELKRRGLLSRSRAAMVVLDLPGLRRHLEEVRG